MLIKALCDYHQILEDRNVLPPKYYSKVDVRHKIALTEDGKLDDIILCEETLKDDGKALVKRPEMLLPKRIETSKISSNIIEHRPTYIFGIEADGKKLVVSEKARKSWNDFKEKNLMFIEGINTPIVNAFRHFIETWNPENETENKKLLIISKISTSKYVFCLSGSPDVLLHDDAEIKQKWEHLCEKQEEQREGLLGQCAIDGEKNVIIPETHGTIKNLRGGASSGCKLVCYNNTSELSYGKKQSQNSDISIDIAEKYVETLNYLLEDKSHHIVLGDDLTVCFFAIAKDGGEQSNNLLNIFAPSASSKRIEMEALLCSLIKRGTQTRISKDELNKLQENIDEDMEFHIIGLKPNMSRIAVKFYYRQKFGELLHNIAKFQENMQLSEQINIVSMDQIVKACISPRSSKNEINPAIFDKLFDAMIYGKPLPKQIYNKMISMQTKIKDKELKEKKYNLKVNTGVIKAYLINNEKEDLKVSLDKEKKDPAYLCGRLFAVAEHLQKQQAYERGIKKLNKTIKDTYFKGALGTPAKVLPKILKLSQTHIKSLKYDSSKTMYDNEFAGIFGTLDSTFPDRINGKEQGIFLIGYYHEKVFLDKKRQEEIEKAKEKKCE